MATIAEYLEQARTEGAFDSDGRFEIDVKEALRKLGQFLLATPEQAALKMVQFAVAQRASALTVESTPHGYCFHFLGLPETRPARQLLGEMVDVLANRVVDRRFDLLVGLNFFLSHGADAVVARWQSGLLIDAASTCADGLTALESLPDPRFPDTLSVEVRFAQGRHRLDEAALRRQLAYCETLVSLDKRKLNLDTQYSGDDGYKSRAELSFPAGEKARTFGVTTLVHELTEVQGFEFPAEIVPVKHGVALEAIEVTAGVPGIRLVVEADDVVTTLGTFDLQPCAAWEARRPLLDKLLNTATEAVRSKHRQLRAESVWLRPISKAGMRDALRLVASLAVLAYCGWQIYWAGGLTQWLDETSAYRPHPHRVIRRQQP